jgi:exonuclease VII small subunit
MTTPAGDGELTPVADLSYTEASRELDAIVGFFEQREVDVDQLVVRLERATAIVDELDRRVRQTRAQVEDLVPRLEAVNRTTAHPADEDDELEDADDVDDIDDDEDVEMIGDPVDIDPGDGDEPALF